MIRTFLFCLVLASSLSAAAQPCVDVSKTPEGKKTIAAMVRVADMTRNAFINGDMVTHKKPNPEIYLTAAQALGINPADCVVIEDAVEGIKAAKAAGMRCIAITNSFPAEKLRDADLVVDSAEHINLEILHQILTQ